MKIYHGSLEKVEFPEIRLPYKLVDQYLFHTERALKFLNFIGAEEIVL